MQSRRKTLRDLGIALTLALTTGTLRYDSQPLSGDAVVTERGKYHLEKNLDSLTVKGDRVEIDGRGYVVGGSTEISGSRCEFSNLRFSGQYTFKMRDCERNSLYQCAIGGPFGGEFVNVDRTEIVHCYGGTDNDILYFDDCHRNTVEGCRFSPAGNVFILNGCSRFRFEGNVTSAVTESYELTDSHRNLIRGNKARSGVTNPVRLEDSSRNRIYDNDFCHLDDPVFVVGDSERNLIRDNCHEV